VNSLRRVVVCGVGLCTPLGLDVRTTMGRLMAGERAFAPMTLFDTLGYQCQTAASIEEIDYTEALPEQGCFHSRADRVAIIAAQQAVQQAGVFPNKVPMELWVASSTAGMLETELQLLDARISPPSSDVQPRFQAHPVSAPASRIADSLGAFTLVRTICSACSSGAIAIGMAALRIQSGACDWVLVGGVDTLCRLTYAGFSALGSMDTNSSRPFDRERKGLTLSEGAGFLLLAAEGAAEQLGVPILGEMAGFGVGCEAFHATKPDPDGVIAERVIRQALDHAGISVEQLDYVSSHGTGTPQNDDMEARLLLRVLGTQASRIDVSSQKGQLGHSLAASGAIEAAISMMAIVDKQVPPNAALKDPDPITHGLSLVGPVGKSKEIRAVISNSFGFGGTDSALVLTQKGLANPQPNTKILRWQIAHTVVFGEHQIWQGKDIQTWIASPMVKQEKLPPDPWEQLDATRARRMDRASKIACLLSSRLMAHGHSLDKEHVGVVGGSAYGSVDASTSFLERVHNKGPRFASPADFPHLVHSASATNVSFYNEIRGPSLSVADGHLTALSVLDVVGDLLRGQKATAMIGFALETKSDMVEHALWPLWFPKEIGERRESGAAFLVQPIDNDIPTSTQAEPGYLAEIEQLVVGTEFAEIRKCRAPNRKTSAVVGVHDFPEIRQFLEQSGWATVPATWVGKRVGFHESAAAVGLALAVVWLQAGVADEVLVPAFSPGALGFVLLVRA
jgi:3-oxoacyl-[acyl-carrier-protein] synthase II